MEIVRERLQSKERERKNWMRDREKGNVAEKEDRMRPEVDVKKLFLEEI